jgi:hypothetical protein
LLDEWRLDEWLADPPRGGQVPPQPLPFRAAVQGRHRAAVPPVCHCPARRAGQGTPPSRHGPVPGGGRPCTPASRTRASSPITSSASSASRRGSCGCPQESPNKVKSRQEMPNRPPYHVS